MPPDPRPPRREGASPPSAADLAEARAVRAALDPAWLDPANDPDAWLFEPAVQQIIAALVEEEVAPYRELLPPDALQALREELLLAAVTDPVSIEYLRRLRPAPQADRSGKRRKGAPGGAAVVAFPKKKAGGTP
jgi:hypothetical protein